MYKETDDIQPLAMSVHRWLCIDYLSGLCLVICIASSYLGNVLVYGRYISKSYNVLDFGAKGDGHTDDSQAFLKAFQAMCGDDGTKGLPTVRIAQGTYFLTPLIFQGPCKSINVKFQVDGNSTFIAPSSPGGWNGCFAGSNWITFMGINGLFIRGTLFVDGHGEAWWNKNTGTNGCPNRPTNLRFQKCNNLDIKGINSRNSPRNHISISDCHYVRISNIQLIAPDESPNTDGIDIASSSQIDIRDSTIATGDDCIAINSGCIGINITNIDCGPGHGISVGSLGKDGSYETVEDVRVEGCTFIGTTNGARIKTWHGGSGYVRRITYNNIKLVKVANPIFIDQDYCISTGSCVIQTPTAVAVSDVTFSRFTGSSITPEAIKLKCSEFTWCKNIVLSNVNITSAVPGKPLTSLCKNVNGKASITTPKVPCLSS